MNKKIVVYLGKTPNYRATTQELVTLITTVLKDLNLVVKNEHLSEDIHNIINDNSVKIVIAGVEEGVENISKIRKDRKDIFLDAIMESANYLDGLNLCKKAGCNLVYVENNGKSMVVAPEETFYYKTNVKTATLLGLLAMTKLRSNLTFTRSTVVAGEPIPWNSELIPSSLRTVVDYCIAHNAYKPFNGSTAGHFAVKLDDNTFLTSIRKKNFNLLKEIGLVKIVTDGPDTVLAYGAKPSVGGQSQRIVFKDHPDVDCIVHFHCKKRGFSKVPSVSQIEYECGSHECGQNTSKGLQKFGNLYAVYLNDHGPNIVFHHSIDPLEVINFIENNFDLSSKTGGLMDNHNVT